ncbi:MAG: dienelactone hydrolase family protein [Rhodoferax sp.]|uniref:alpha/beta hydrolase n=1 Tax=Polynucleobacter sp. MG-Unter2-18 TaxID=2081052 RepID=UPI001BFDC481|nr:alpha/beta hydrolase [Polynucleobacter sp. MG-Unter2-18]MCF8165648.1 dienelactone hydrolase family protein [Rhodoferax sp.]MCF8190146.1 dienelactone hydrolase family protein [Polynucleobacter sp.]QWD95164.1 dienelactone hydrolase family protein [Polynucleobacter sp. MG-Unter2-18]
MTALPCIEIETAPNPSAAVIWLHGLGADGNDFVPIIPQLNLSECPAIRFVFPSAPSMAVTVNGGYVMPAWYDITERDINAREDLAGIHKSAAAISQLIEREASRGIAYEKIVLAGFSQGCAMSLQVGLRFPHRLAGIMALSGYLPLANSLALERSEANGKTPILMAHGVWDAVITLERAEASADILEKLGYQVDWNTYPMEHSLHPDELVDISRFLSTVLSRS